tara:strand:- start:640 stop:1200 length:561 start_codon:yes stop_codon:yes gene_type:complete
MNVILISELVNKDGSRIKGDAKVDQDNNMTTSKITTDDFVHMTRQGLSRYNNFGRIYYGEDDESKKDAKIPKKDKKKKKPKKAKKIKESGRLKMNSIIEDIFTKKDFDKEFVDTKIKDLKSKGIESLESIRDTNPILIRKVGALKDIIEKNSASGEEKAVILNHLLSMDISDIPNEYKQELKKRLG